MFESFYLTKCTLRVPFKFCGKALKIPGSHFFSVYQVILNDKMYFAIKYKFNSLLFLWRTYKYLIYKKNYFYDL